VVDEAGAAAKAGEGGVVKEAVKEVKAVDSATVAVSA
jgi:hypothetical protein